MTPENDVWGVGIAPASVASSATSTATIDTYVSNRAGKADYCQISFIGGTAASATAMLALSIKEGTDTNASNMTSIAALTGGTNTGNFTLPTLSGTSGSKILTFHIDLRKRQRYLYLSATPGTTQLIAATYRLSRLNEAVHTASLRGETLFVEV